MKYVEMTLEQARTVINGIDCSDLPCEFCPYYEGNSGCNLDNGQCFEAEIIASAGMIIGRESMRQEFEVDEPVMVRDKNIKDWDLRFYAGKVNGKHYCFSIGHNSKTTDAITFWEECRKLTAEERERHGLDNAE